MHYDQGCSWTHPGNSASGLPTYQSRESYGVLSPLVVPVVLIISDPLFSKTMQMLALQGFPRTSYSNTTSYPCLGQHRLMSPDVNPTEHLWDIDPCSCGTFQPFNAIDIQEMYCCHQHSWWPHEILTVSDICFYCFKWLSSAMMWETLLNVSYSFDSFDQFWTYPKINHADTMNLLLAFLLQFSIYLILCCVIYIYISFAIILLWIYNTVTWSYWLSMPRYLKCVNI